MRARDAAGRQYNIEVQLREETYYVERPLYYLAKLYSDQLESGKEYDKLRRTVAISTLDFPLFPDLPELHTRFRFCDPAHGLELSDILEIHYLELTKFRRDQPLVTPLEKWLHLLKFAELYGLGLEELPGPIQAEEEMVMALDAMNGAYASDEVRYLIEGRLKAERDEKWRLRNAIERAVEKGLAQGRSEGRAEAEALSREAEAMSREKIARKLLEQGLDPESIYEATGVRLDP